MRADAIVALAFDHHLAIGRNLPLDQVVDWLIGLAPSGVIEFVQKTDSTVQQMLALREDIFAGYTEPAFTAAVIRSEEHTSELQSLMRISYAVFCLKKKKITCLKNNKHKQQRYRSQYTTQCDSLPQL